MHKQILVMVAMTVVLISVMIISGDDGRFKGEVQV